MIRTKQSRLYRLAMVCAMIVVGLNTWLASRELNTLFVAQGWRAHTLEVLTHTKSIELGMAQSNDTVRGYLLTGLPQYEQLYREAQQRAAAEVSTVQQLTADNQSQQDRIAFLKHRMTVRFAALDTGLAIRSTSGVMSATALDPVMNASPDGGPTVSYVLTQIEAEEARLLAQRTAGVDRAKITVWASFIGASLLDVLLILAAFEFLIRITRDRHTLAQRTEQLAHRAEEIATLNAELKTLNSDLEERVAQRTRELELANQELEAFSYSVSHDLRAPLRTIDGFSLALQEDFADKLNDEGRDYITRVRNGVQRMGSLIDALLQLSRVTRGELTRERLDISQLATLVFNELQAATPEQDVSFVAQPAVTVQADPRLLRIALENLIGNAYKFTSKKPGAKIEFGTEPGTGSHAGSTVYFIRDNGAGFDMHYVDRLFTAFQRLHGDRDFKGSGIGLATVSRIIRRHHGSIWASSKAGEGATFSFTLAP